jgi:hypothetical protein
MAQTGPKDNQSIQTTSHARIGVSPDGALWEQALPWSVNVTDNACGAETAEFADPLLTENLTIRTYSGKFDHL